MSLVERVHHCQPFHTRPKPHRRTQRSSVVFLKFRSIEEVLLRQRQRRRCLASTLHPICCHSLESGQHSYSHRIRTRPRAYKSFRIHAHLWRCSIILHVVLVEAAAILDSLYALSHAVRLDGACRDACLRYEKNTRRWNHGLYCVSAGFEAHERV